MSSSLLFRVFKKSSANGKITVYLGKRDFVDHITHVDPIGELKISTWFEIDQIVNGIHQIIRKNLADHFAILRIFSD